jgi:hypothetical protein
LQLALTVHNFHYPWNKLLSAAIRQARFEDLAVFGSPFGQVCRHPDAPLPSFSPCRRFPRFMGGSGKTPDRHVIPATRFRIGNGPGGPGGGGLLGTRLVVPETLKRARHRGQPAAALARRITPVFASEGSAQMSGGAAMPEF